MNSRLIQSRCLEPVRYVFSSRLKPRRIRSPCWRPTFLIMVVWASGALPRLFQGEQDAVLFDTGFKEDTVLHNVLHLGVDLSGVEKVVLSHFHSDHTGGLLILREHFRPANEAALSQVYVAAGFFDQRATINGC